MAFWRENMEPLIPVPDAPQAWLEEIAMAYNDAYQTIALAGQTITPENLVYLAPQACLKLRGFRQSASLLKRATEEGLPGVHAVPQLAFAFSYLASHIGLEILDPQVVATIMKHVENNRDALLEMTRRSGW